MTKKEFEWKPITNKIPSDFSLCELKKPDGSIKNGWRYGEKWEGLKISPVDQFVEWRRLAR